MGEELSRKWQDAYQYRIGGRKISDKNGQSRYRGENARMTVVSSSYGRRDAQSLGLEKIWRKRRTESLDVKKRGALVSCVRCGRLLVASQGFDADTHWD